MKLRTKRVTGKVKVYAPCGNLKKLTEKQIEERENGAVVVYFQEIKPEELKEIREIYAIHDSDDVLQRPEYDEIGLALALWKRKIVGWENALDEDGQQIECTDETKELVYNCDQQFVNDTLRAIRVVVSQRKDLEEKN